MSAKESPDIALGTSALSGAEKPPEQDPHAELEKMLISGYLRDKGYALSSLKSLPHEQAEALMKEASRYASAKLAELESRAHLVDEVHKAATPLE